MRLARYFYCSKADISYKSIKNIITAGQDKPVEEPKETTTQNKYGITRGADYYRR